MGEAKRRRTSGTISEARLIQAGSVAESVDRVTEADRRWFERRPHRQHRVRLMARSEGVQRAAVFDRDRCPSPLPGWQWATVVRQVTPGLRIRLNLFTIIEADLDEASEEDCRRLLDLAAGPEGCRLEDAFHGLGRGGAA